MGDDGDPLEIDKLTVQDSGFPSSIDTAITFEIDEGRFHNIVSLHDRLIDVR